MRPHAELCFRRLKDVMESTDPITAFFGFYRPRVFALPQARWNAMTDYPPQPHCLAIPTAAQNAARKSLCTPRRGSQDLIPHVGLLKCDPPNNCHSA